MKRSMKGQPNSLKNNKGYSLVELIIAIAMLAIVITAVCSFIVAGSKHYQWSNNEITIQEDAQMAINQMSDVVIDTNRAVCYYGCPEGGSDIGTAQSGLTDDDIAVKLGGNIGDKYLAVYNGETTTDETTGITTESVVTDSAGNRLGNDRNYVFHFVKDDKTIEYYEKEITGSVAAEDPNLDDWDGPYLFAEHVEDFSVDLSAFSDDETEDHIIVADGKRVIGLSLKFEMGNRTYDTSNNVTVRNRLAVNTGEFITVPKTKTVRIVTSETSAILEPNDRLDLDGFFGPKVKGRNVEDDSFSWEIDGLHDSGTRIVEEDGTHRIYIGTNEKNSKIKLKVASNEKDADNNSAETRVYINLKRVTGVSVNRIDPDEKNTVTRRYKALPTSTLLNLGEDLWVQTQADGSFLTEKCDGQHYARGHWVSCADYFTTEADPYEEWKDTSIEFPPCVVNSTKSATVFGDGDGNPGEAAAGKFVWFDYGWSPRETIKNHIVPNEGVVHLKVCNNAPKGGSFFIGAKSDLARARGYKVNPADPDDYSYSQFFIAAGDPIKLDKELFYGRNTQITGKFVDQTPYHHYVIAVRINTNQNDYANDAVFFYYSEGTTISINLDIFGLDWRNKYYISIQLFSYKQQNNWDNPGQSGIANYAKDAYSNNQHFDMASGLYTETSRFSVSGVYRGEITPPVIEYIHPTTGAVYTGTQMKLNDVIKSDYTQETTINLYRPNVKVDGINPTSGTDGAVRYKGYKDGSQILDSVTNNSMNYSPEVNGIGLENFALNGTGGVPKIRFKPGEADKKDASKDNAYGTYTFVPFICYANDITGDHSSLYNTIFYRVNKSFTDHYERLTKECPESTISMRVLPAKVNVNTWTMCNNALSKVDFYFPTPSETSFRTYFNRKNENLQECKAASMQFTMYYDNLSKNTKANFSRITCEYIKSEDKYRLEFFYEVTDAWGKKINVSAGTYTCNTNGSEWTKEKAGWYDEYFNSQALANSVSLADFRSRYQGNTTVTGVSINRTDYNGYAYIPLPMDEDFTKDGALHFTRKTAAGQSSITYKYKFKKNGATNVIDLGNITTKVTYDAATDTYTMIWYDASDSDRQAAEFTYKEGQRGWAQK